MHVQVCVTRWLPSGGWLCWTLPSALSGESSPGLPCPHEAACTLNNLPECRDFSSGGWDVLSTGVTRGLQVLFLTGFLLLLP